MEREDWDEVEDRGLCGGLGLGWRDRPRQEVKREDSQLREVGWIWLGLEDERVDSNAVLSTRRSGVVRGT